MGCRCLQRQRDPVRARFWHAAGVKGLGCPGARARADAASALWALFNVSADQHVLRCVRVTDAVDTIVEICVVSGRGTSSIYLLLGTGRIVMRAHPASTPRARHTTTRPSSEYGPDGRGRRGVNSVGRPPATRQQITNQLITPWAHALAQHTSHAPHKGSFTDSE
jgi:hypothetical protein